MPNISAVLIVIAVIVCVLALIAVAMCLAAATGPRSDAERAREDEVQARYLSEYAKEHARKHL